MEGKPNGDFDWHSLQSPRWTPLSAFSSSPVHVTRGLFRVGDGVYALTNHEMNGSEIDPGVGSILWAMSAPVALLVYDRVLPSAYVEECPPPPSATLGLGRFTLSGALDYCRRMGMEPFQTAAYRYPDGLFTIAKVVVGSREFIFRQANPTPDETPIAVLFRLPGGA